MKNYIIVFLLISSISVTAQEYWINTIGGSSYDHCTSITLDNQENIIIVGWITGTAHFNNETITGSGNNSRSRFIAKYTANDGALIWVQKVADSITYIRHVKIDNEDNIYITGTTGGNTDYFISKYNTNGILKWSRTGKGSGVNSGTKIEIINDDVYVIGYFHDSAIFNDTTIIASGSGDLFFAKYNTLGDLIFIKQPFIGNSLPVDLRKDSSNNLYFLCRTTATDTIGLTVTKFDTSNYIVWEKYFNGLEDEIISNFIEPSALSIYDSNNIILCGNFWGELHSDIDTISSYSENDYFVICLGSSGELKWINQDISSEFGDGLTSITITNDFNIYAIGNFFDILQFYNDSSVNAYGICNSDMIIAKYDSIGNLNSVNIGGGDGSYCDYGVEIISKDTLIFFSGIFGGTGNFGEDIVQSYGKSDVVFGRYNEHVTWGLPTSIKNYNSLIDSIIIFPNPIADILHITNIPVDSKEKMIQLINIHGQIIKKYLLENKRRFFDIDFTGMQKGLYVIQIISNEEIYISKLIKK